MISLKDLIILIRNSTKQNKKNECMILIDIAFVLLDFIIHFSFPHTHLKDKKEISENSPKSINDEIINSKATNQIYLKSNKTLNTENDKKIPLKNIYCDMVLFLLGNYYLANQYDIYVRILIYSKIKFNQFLKLEMLKKS